MTAVLRTLAMCSALLFLNTASAAGQIAARATYVGDGSFELPTAGRISPRDPVAIAVAPNGALHVVDGDGQVVVFGRDGAPDRTYGAGRLNEPLAIAFDELGRVYVLDKGLKQVQVYNERGEQQLVIGGDNRGVSQLGDPVALALGPRGFVYSSR